MASTSLAEPWVDFALRELVSSGDTVIDLGANVGGLTTEMSRLVGPRGTVIAFEANDAVFRCDYFADALLHYAKTTDDKMFGMFGFWAKVGWAQFLTLRKPDNVDPFFSTLV